MKMVTYFGQIFWGLLVVILDFHFNRVDILPDFVGYVLIAIGCRGLVFASRHFSTASVMSWVLLTLNLLEFAFRGDEGQVFQWASLVFDSAMMWFLLGGVMELATAHQRMDLSESASKRRIAYVVLRGLLTLTGLVAEGSRGVATVIAVAGLVCMLSLLFLILHLIHRAKSELTHDRAVS
jgi:hypothetical protein